MNRFIKKNLFLVGVLAISAAGILLLLGMSAVKYFEMNKYQAETRKMTESLDELNNPMRTPIPPFRSNVSLVNQDTEGYKKLKHSIQGYFGQTLQDALAVFVADLRRQSMEKLISLAELFEKSPQLGKLKKEFADANAQWRKSMSEADKFSAELKKAYKNSKKIEEDEETQEGKARAVAENQKRIAELSAQYDKAVVRKRDKLNNTYEVYKKLLTCIADLTSGSKEAAFKSWAAKNKEDAREFEFYNGICQQNLTVEVLLDTFREFWNEVKEQQGPRKQTYKKFRLERGATIEQQGAGKNKPVLWDADMWNNSIVEFVKEAQKTMLEKIDDKNMEEIFLYSLGLLRNLDKMPALLEAHSVKMNDLIRETLEKGNVFVTGMSFSKSPLELIKSNKGFADTGNTRNVAVSNSVSGSENQTALYDPAADPSDVIRNWDIIADIAQRMVNANVDSLEKLSYVDLAGNSSNSNYKKYTYIITCISRENQIRTFMQLLTDACKENRMYVIKRLSIQKQEDQIQDIIDFASGIIGKPENTQDNKDNSNSGESSGTNSLISHFIETKNYPECVAGRSTLCRVTLVVDYVELTGNQLK